MFTVATKSMQLNLWLLTPSCRRTITSSPNRCCVDVQGRGGRKCFIETQKIELRLFLKQQQDIVCQVKANTVFLDPGFEPLTLENRIPPHDDEFPLAASSVTRLNSEKCCTSVQTIVSVNMKSLIVCCLWASFRRNFINCFFLNTIFSAATV